MKMKVKSAECDFAIWRPLGTLERVRVESQDFVLRDAGACVGEDALVPPGKSHEGVM